MSFKSYFGIDGAAGGWVLVSSKKNKLAVEFVKQLSELNLPKCSIALIDMPIGLPTFGYRQCDLLGRKLLSVRRASLFYAPSREAVYAKSYLESCQRNLPKQHAKLSKQVWNLCPKIKELDLLLRSKSNLKEILLESHPELAFLRLNDNQPLKYSKKTINGRRERVRLLSAFFGSDKINELLEFSNSIHPKLLEDIIDACSLVGLLKLSKGRPEFVGDHSLDQFKLPMQIAC